MSYIGQGLEYGRMEKFVFTASGSETSITTADDGRSIAYSIGYVDVYINGVRMISGTDYTATSGDSITGLAALTADDVVEIVAHNVSSLSDAVSQQSGGTFNGEVTFSENTFFTANTEYGDNDYLKLGDSGDLQIYHDGSHSYIDDVGTGSIILKADDSFGVYRGSTPSAIFDTNAEVSLYHNGNQKLATTAQGVSVTGRAVGTLTTDNDLSFDMQASNQFKCTPSGSGTLTFTNITSGQSGNIFLVNSGGHAISAAATTYISAADLTAISTAGSYFLSYFSDGTNVMVSASAAVTSAGA